MACESVSSSQQGCAISSLEAQCFYLAEVVVEGVERKPEYQPPIVDFRCWSQCDDGRAVGVVLLLPGHPSPPYLVCQGLCQCLAWFGMVVGVMVDVPAEKTFQRRSHLPYPYQALQVDVGVQADVAGDVDDQRRPSPALLDPCAMKSGSKVSFGRPASELGDIRSSIASFVLGLPSRRPQLRSRCRRRTAPTWVLKEGISSHGTVVVSAFT